jgi:peptidoglycan hydrolase-like protein with peptidoglycan-binding domain
MKLSLSLPLALALLAGTAGVADAQMASGTADLLQAQQALHAAGLYDGRYDGVMNTDMQTALSNYQTAHGLSRSGTLDAQTAAALGIQPPTSAVYGASAPTSTAVTSNGPPASH